MLGYIEPVVATRARAEEIQIIEEFPSEEWWEKPIEKTVEEEPSEERPAKKKPWWKFW